MHTNSKSRYIRARQNIRWHFVVCFTFQWNRPHRKMSWNIGNWKAYSNFFRYKARGAYIHLAYLTHDARRVRHESERDKGRGSIANGRKELETRPFIHSYESHHITPFFNFHGWIKTLMSQTPTCWKIRYDKAYCRSTTRSIFFIKNAHIKN